MIYINKRCIPATCLRNRFKIGAHECFRAARTARPMRLTIYTDYTLRALLYLGVHRDAGRLSTIGDIASAYGISENHLRKVVHHLAKEGYVETTRGKGGGMRLARQPEHIVIGDVVRSTEEDLALVECFQREGRCPISSACRLAGVLDAALNAFFAVLDRHTLADLLQPEAQLARIFRA